jgi:hypothetical protein
MMRPRGIAFAIAACLQPMYSKLYNSLSELVLSAGPATSAPLPSPPAAATETATALLCAAHAAPPLIAISMVTAFISSRRFSDGMIE